MRTRFKKNMNPPVAPSRGTITTASRASVKTDLRSVLHFAVTYHGVLYF